MIVLDAGVLIAYLDERDPHHTRAEALLTRESADEFGANPLTIAEVLVGPAQQDLLARAVRVLTDIGVRELPFPSTTAPKIAELRATTRLKMPDCCVLLAVESEDARLATFDQRLAETAAARGVTVVDH